MKNETEIKELVREKYGEIARSPARSSCCGTQSCCSGGTNSYIGESYTGVDGYQAEADLGLGCGLPTEHAGIREGMTVLDVGSGAGNDVFVARRIVGENGRVIGVDMTPDMVKRARENAEKLDYGNVEFRLGDIESLPVESNVIDVVISNCVLNLVPGKDQAFAEIHRVLKPGGHFCISDIVVTGPLPEIVREAAEMYVGCIAGALQRNAYLDLVRNSGFENVEVVKEEILDLPDHILDEKFEREMIDAYRNSPNRAMSMTLKGQRTSSTS